MSPAATLHDAKGRHFAGCCAASLAFAPPPKQAQSSSVSQPGKLKSVFCSMLFLKPEQNQ